MNLLQVRIYPGILYPLAFNWVILRPFGIASGSQGYSLDQSTARHRVKLIPYLLAWIIEISWKDFTLSRSTCTLGLVIEREQGSIVGGLESV